MPIDKTTNRKSDSHTIYFFRSCLNTAVAENLKEKVITTANDDVVTANLQRKHCIQQMSPI